MTVTPKYHLEATVSSKSASTSFAAVVAQLQPGKIAPKAQKGYAGLRSVSKHRQPSWEAHQQASRRSVRHARSCPVPTVQPHSANAAATNLLQQSRKQFLEESNFLAAQETGCGVGAQDMVTDKGLRTTTAAADKHSFEAYTENGARKSVVRRGSREGRHGNDLTNGVPHFHRRRHSTTVCAVSSRVALHTCSTPHAGSTESHPRAFSIFRQALHLVHSHRKRGDQGTCVGMRTTQ